MRKLFRVFLFLTLTVSTLPASAQIRISLSIGLPPPPRHEVVVEAPFPGAVWISGYYVYNSGSARYDWVPGRWQAPPSPNHIWVAPRYVRRGDHYEYYEGTWKDNGKHKGWSKQKGPKGKGNSPKGRGNKGR
ncbi:MAG: hypothetical protein Q8916_00385 [Bacteroidota bacterium]|nr:hypothetical protein [Bacteroidota bacterium]MDP4228844.1 hypothetical protein [Bacteroidota bacterium]MDP4235796.1 hypothetical protein [Bacteroidota bacterium]